MRAQNPENGKEVGEGARERGQRHSEEGVRMPGLQLQSFCLFLAQSSMGACAVSSMAFCTQVWCRH